MKRKINSIESKRYFDALVESITESVAALARSMRRVGLLALAAARPAKEAGGGKAPGAALAVAGGIVGLIVLRKVIRRVRG